ncbi:DUF2461 family protein [Pararhodobacter aggregans]|uniref:DUF2461 family protein n=1 Tax=Pararhodobacter aggregans TaxID=404875 RepID=UPI0023540A16|nr:DUF2461 family protein [Pararhodobacter aggregans]
MAGIMEEIKARDLRLDSPELKRLPAPCPADHPRADLLRRKSLRVRDEDYGMDSAFGPAAPARIAAALTAFAPLHAWLRTALA